MIEEPYPEESTSLFVCYLWKIETLKAEEMSENQASCSMTPEEATSLHHLLPVFAPAGVLLCL